MATEVLLDPTTTLPFTILPVLPTSAPHLSTPLPKSLRPSLRCSIETAFNPFPPECHCGDCDDCNNRDNDDNDGGDDGGNGNGNSDGNDDNNGTCQCEPDEKTLSDRWLSKATQLCEYLWPSAQHGVHSVQYLSRGSFNAAFSFSMTKTDGQSAEYVLRIPLITRGYSDVVHTAAILEYLAKYTDLKVPEVITWDATENNPLENSYIIMSRVPGKCLQDVWDDLTHHQKLRLAKELAHLYLQIESITHPIAGHMNVHKKNFHPGDEVSNHLFVQPFGTEVLELPENPINWCNSGNGLLPLERLQHDPPGLSTDDIMLAIFKRRIYQAENREAPFSSLYEIFDPCLDIVEQMADMELFEPPNDIICLHHSDLFPRNIMVDFSPDITITGIIDWDDAVFVPRFAGRISPRWLWVPWDEGESDSSDLREDPLDPKMNEPDSPENAEIKKVFEDAMGENWVSEANDRRYDYARELLQFSTLIFHREEDIKKIHATIEEWKSLFAQDSDDSTNSESGQAVIDVDDTEGETILNCSGNQDTYASEDILEHETMSTCDEALDVSTKEDSDDSNLTNTCKFGEDNTVLSSATETITGIQEYDGSEISAKPVNSELTPMTAAPPDTMVTEHSNAACDEYDILSAGEEKHNYFETSTKATIRAIQLPESHYKITVKVPKSAFSGKRNSKRLSITVDVRQEPENNDSDTESDVRPTFTESGGFRDGEPSPPSSANSKNNGTANDSGEPGVVLQIILRTPVE
ncbi:hypothetical protein F4776DRAFT_602087 [Hypoxylon sp. NC0597]|nr:hypothetical protein F4776DRAFT_602087 [Hypoxylon sp. NC0597]